MKAISKIDIKNVHFQFQRPCRTLKYLGWLLNQLNTVDLDFSIFTSYPYDIEYDFKESRNLCRHSFELES